MSDDLVKRLEKRQEFEYIDGCKRIKWEDEDALEAVDRIKELEAKLTSLVQALSYEGLRTDEAEAKLTIAMVGLVQSRDELDLYSQNEYPSDHPVHERYRKRDYDANPARIAIAKIKGEQP